MTVAEVRRFARNRTVLDWLPVAVFPPVFVAEAALQTDGPPLTVVGVLAAVVGCLPVVLRRRLRFLTLAPLLTAGIVLVLWGLEPGGTVALIPMLALFELARAGLRKRTVWIAPAVVPCVAIGALPFADDAAEFASIFVRNVALCWLALAAGDIVRHQLAEQARLLRDRDEAARRSVDAERLRIARDVHDVVAHAMVAINVQAGVAAHLLDRDSSAAHAALRSIKQASGDALTDLRATLGALREDGAGGVPERPAIGLADLDELAGALRSAGVDVVVDVDVADSVPAPVHFASYRIVQEALTNVLRHAEATNAGVSVRRPNGALEIEVRNDGVGARDRANGARADTGSGLRGMRERAAALGGTVEAGPTEIGGWRVLARLPITATDAEMSA